MRERGWLAIRIAFTYIGTVVGAGFASGQEILQFFSIFGKYATWGILIAIILFSWLGTRMMLMGHRLQASSYEEFNYHLFGPHLGRWMTIFVSINLFGVTSAMMSGIGSLFREQLGLSFHLGILLTCLLSFFVMRRGMNGILSLNSLIVPLMFVFTVVISVQGWLNGSIGAILLSPPAIAGKHWLISTIIYVALNLVMSQAVLVPLGAEISDSRMIRIGGWLGGLGLGVMMLASNFALQIHMEHIVHLDIPMAYVISTLGLSMKYFFLAVMWSEIFTTLVGNVYGLAINLRQVLPWRMTTIMVGIFLVGYLFSLIGFPAMVKHVYPLFGYFGLLLLLLLIVRRVPRV